ncbi:MAG: bifunctional shikimate kinase/3-dehydroquinate synthase [Dehalococcoidia bacterium]
MSDTAHPARIVLVGLSGTGKSAVARLVAERLGWTWHDTDADVVAGDGRAIDRIFTEAGEPEFRRLERAAVAAAAARRQAVIATGGGAPLDVANRAALWAGAFVVELQARPETAVARMTAAGEGIGGRPMLGGDDPRARLERLRVERGPIYALADWTVRVDGLDAAAVAEEVVAAWERHGGLLSRTGRMDAALSVAPPADPAADDPDLAAVVDTPGGRYAAYAGWEILGRLPRWLRAAGLSGVAHVVADRRVANLHGQRLLDILAEGGFEVAMHAIDLDESRKSLDAAEQVFDELVADRAERKHTIIAFGGGVATDLGGFVAATYLRGLPLVHISTSLLGMVDAAIGGKVAVNHRAGKNLIGAFYQPRLVVADAALLQTLPRREFLSGWAEVIKHALIMDTELLGWLERDAEALLRLEPEPTARVLRRSMALKARVVSADEREDGVR